MEISDIERERGLTKKIMKKRSFITKREEHNAHAHDYDAVRPRRGGFSTVGSAWTTRMATPPNHSNRDYSHHSATATTQHDGRRWWRPLRLRGRRPQR
eukprot:8236767-Pyramimonas_sp.AAC.1